MLWQKYWVQFQKIATYIPKLSISIALYSDFPFHTPKRTTGSAIILWCMAFKVWRNAQILSNNHQTWSITLAKHWDRGIGQESPPHRSDIIQCEWLSARQCPFAQLEPRFYIFLQQVSNNGTVKVVHQLLGQHTLLIWPLAVSFAGILSNQK